jgi:plastocyanin
MMTQNKARTARLLLLVGVLVVTGAGSINAAASNQTITSSGGTCPGDGTPAWTNANPTVNVGDTVTWNNCSGGNHGLQSTSNGWCLANGSTSGSSGSNWTYSCKFTAAGTYSYQCSVHMAAMAGTVTVAAPAASPSAAAGAQPTQAPGPTAPRSGASASVNEGPPAWSWAVLALLALTAGGGAIYMRRRTQ